MEIRSDTYDAQNATEQLRNIDQVQSEQISISKSNIQSLINSSKVSNEMADDLNQIITSIDDESSKFPELAEIIEQRDYEDAQEWGFE